MLLQTVCPHGNLDSELEAALARILGFLLEDQTLATSPDCGRSPPQVNSVGVKIICDSQVTR